MSEPTKSLAEELEWRQIDDTREDDLYDSEGIDVSDEEAPPGLVSLPSAPTWEQLETEESPPRFAALRHRNFRLFWTGNVVSLVGTLAQNTAQSWLVRTLTPDPGTISLVAACGTLPILLLTLYTGVVADRVDKRRALILTNTVAAILALLLAFLTYRHEIHIWQVAVISLGVGIVNAFDIPIRQSFNVEMVGRQDLPNAIALNSSAFNGARVAGPAAGGFLLGTIGMAGCFVANAISFVALIVGLGMMHLAPHTPVERRVRTSDFAGGFLFIRRHELLGSVTLLVAMVSLFAMSFGTLLSVFAKDVFHSDERGFAVLLTCNGSGALAAAVVLAASSGMRHKGKRLLLGAFLFCASVAAFGLAPNLLTGCALLMPAGWFLLTFLMTANTMIQTLAPDELRGRVFSLYSLALIGTAPVGAVMLGWLARHFGARHAVEASALFATAITFAVFLKCRDLWKAK